MYFATPAFDKSLFLFINQDLHCGLLNVVMPLFSSRLVLLALGAAALAWGALRLGRRHLALMLLVLLAMGLADATSNLVKDGVDRVRPYKALAGVWHVSDGEWRQLPDDFVQTDTGGSSYPSAHAANTACLAVLAMLFWPRLRFWPLALPLLTGLSRVYLGKHYPTDVLAGWLFGLFWAGLVWLVWTAWAEAYVRRRWPRLLGG